MKLLIVVILLLIAWQEYSYKFYAITNLPELIDKKNNVSAKFEFSKNHVNVSIDVGKLKLNMDSGYAIINSRRVVLYANDMIYILSLGRVKESGAPVLRAQRIYNNELTTTYYQPKDYTGDVNTEELEF